MSEACRRTAAFWSKGEDQKVQRNPKHLSSSVQVKGEIDSERTEMKQNIISDRLHCLITGCNDICGKGYKASYFGKHIHSHKLILRKSSDEREKVTLALQKWGNRVLCK